jgi:hypothetical protein
MPLWTSTSASRARACRRRSKKYREGETPGRYKQSGGSALPHDLLNTRTSPFLCFSLFYSAVDVRIDRPSVGGDVHIDGDGRVLRESRDGMPQQGEQAFEDGRPDLAAAAPSAVSRRSPTRPSARPPRSARRIHAAAGLNAQLKLCATYVCLRSARLQPRVRRVPGSNRIVRRIRKMSSPIHRAILTPFEALIHFVGPTEQRAKTSV